MKRLGVYMALAGVLLIVLPYFNLTIMFLGQIDDLGETTAWAIKIGLIVIGAVLFFTDKSSSKKTTTKEPLE